jgi:hypothetical protein
MKLMTELERNYMLVNKMFIVCKRRGLKLIMENPYSKEHFLVRYWCIPATIIDHDRRENGDYYAKPTQYWFVGFKPRYNFLVEAIKYNSLDLPQWEKRKKSDYIRTGADSIKTARSMIHPDYANRFIRQYILPTEEGT